MTIFKLNEGNKDGRKEDVAIKLIIVAIVNQSALFFGRKRSWQLFW